MLPGGQGVCRAYTGHKNTVKWRQPAINDVSLEQSASSLLFACPLHAGRSLAGADEFASGLPSGVRCDPCSVGAGEYGVAAVVERDVRGVVRPGWGTCLDADPAFGAEPEYKRPVRMSHADLQRRWQRCVPWRSVTS